MVEGACVLCCVVSAAQAVLELHSVGSKFRFAGGQLDKQAVSWCLDQAQPMQASQPASL